MHLEAVGAAPREKDRIAWFIFSHGDALRAAARAAVPSLDLETLRAASPAGFEVIRVLFAIREGEETPSWNGGNCRL